MKARIDGDSQGRSTGEPHYREVSQRPLGDRFAGLVTTGTVTHVAPRQSVIALAIMPFEESAVLTWCLSLCGGTCLDSLKMALLCLAEDITSANRWEDFASV